MQLWSPANWIVWALALKCRMLWVEQIARWLNTSPGSANTLAQSLVKRRLAEEVMVRAQVLGALEEPLLRQRFGEGTVSAGRISWRAKHRYAGVPTRDLKVFIAGPKAISLYGLPPRRRPNPEHASHDLGCAEMFLYALRHWPRLTTLYYEMEDIYAAERADIKFAKVEDARLHRRDRTMMVFEYAGRYSTERVRSFIADMAERRLSFFLM